VKCPKCNVDMKIKDTTIVERPDGSYAKRMRLTCVTKKCENFGKIVETVYHPIKVEKEG